jgi:low affinity Fe/Cu permease
MNVGKKAAGKFLFEVLVVFAVSMCICLIAFPMMSFSATWQHVLRESAESSSKIAGVFVAASVLQWIFANIGAVKK